MSHTCVTPYHTLVLHHVTHLCYTMSHTCVTPCHTCVTPCHTLVLHHDTHLCYPMSHTCVTPCHTLVLHHVTLVLLKYDYLYSLTEYADGGTLRKTIKNFVSDQFIASIPDGHTLSAFHNGCLFPQDKPFPWHRRISIARDIAAGMVRFIGAHNDN